mgnify:CR=1 FL=1
MERISVIGAGYVGLVSAVCFADRGYRVSLSTHDPKKVKQVNNGIAPFYEEGLEPLLKKAVAAGNLRASLGRYEAVLESDMSFVAVATPSSPDGRIDLDLIEASSREIGEALRKKTGYHLVVVRSTVVPGTTENTVKLAVEKHSKKKAGEGFGIAMQPEFLRQGSAVFDTMNPDRVVIGEYDARSGDMLDVLYRDFYRNKDIPILRMNLASAEMIKYASNAFLATKISFINELANLCERVNGLDINKIAEGMGLDKRIGRHFLRAGVGYGGSCFPKDVSALIAYGKQLGYEPKILNAITSVNRTQALHAVELAKRHVGNLTGKKVALLGLSFKPGTDDLREAPSLRIINSLVSEGARVVAYDPVAMENARQVLGDKIQCATSTEDCLEHADCCIIVTEWDEFKKLKPEDFVQRMNSAVLIDGRRVYDPRSFGQRLTYVGIGLAT